MEPNDPESDGEAAGSGSFTQSKMQRERKIKEKEKKERRRDKQKMLCQDGFYGKYHTIQQEQAAVVSNRRTQPGRLGWRKGKMDGFSG